MTTMQVAKKELRTRIKKILAGVSRDSIIFQSSIATQRLCSLPEYHSAQRLSIYLSMPTGELETTEIVRDAFKRGKQVFVPYIYQQKTTSGAENRSPIMEMLALDSIDDYESLQPDKWGIPTLDVATLSTRKNCFGGHGLRGESVEAVDGEETGLDLVVVPGLGFDQQLRRIGHGKGYYDHFLNRGWGIQRDGIGRRPYLVALALSEQVLPESEQIPVADHDRIVDTVIIGDGRVLNRTDLEE
ncbi:hypothetical protein FQN57_001848 [Myotisia sp. PD_48]|nr:hypothetical protein FQN57_001848 [Myotisia sp. PD_48]